MSLLSLRDSGSASRGERKHRRGAPCHGGRAGEGDAHKPETFASQIVPEADPITERCFVMAQFSVWLSREKRKSSMDEMERFTFMLCLQKNESAIALVKPAEDKLNAYVAKITYLGYRVKK